MSTTLRWPIRLSSDELVDAPIARREATRHRAPVAADVTVVVVAHNAATQLPALIHSLRRQTRVPSEIIVVDDHSPDALAAVARALAVTLVRPPERPRSTADARNFALQFVETEYVVTADADMSLSPNAISLLRAAFADDRTGLASGPVLPWRVSSLWERGLYVETMAARSHEDLRDFYGSASASGGPAMWRTSTVRDVGGWPERTISPELDLAWEFQRVGARVSFVPDAIGYVHAPRGFRAAFEHLSQRSLGVLEATISHGADGRGRGRGGRGRLWIAAGLCDAVITTSAFLVILPVLAVLLGELWPLLGYVVDIPVIGVMLLATAHRRGEKARALASLPAFVVWRLMGAAAFAHALVSGIFRQRRSAGVPDAGAT